MTLLKVANYFSTFSWLKRLIADIRHLLTLVYCDQVCSVSHSSVSDIQNRYSFIPFFKSKLANLKVVYNGIDHIKPDSFAKSTISSKGNFLLYVGDRRPHKNLIYSINLVKKINSLSDKTFFLVIAGPTTYLNRDVIDHISNNRDLIVEYPSPSDSELSFLYTHSSGLIFPSLSEGFGIPIFEAALHNTSIILSDIPVFREISPPGCLFCHLITSMMMLLPL